MLFFCKLFQYGASLNFLPMVIIPFPNKSLSLCVCSTRVWKEWIHYGKRKKYLKGAFSPFPTVFSTCLEKFLLFLWNCSVQTLSVWKGLQKLVVWEKVKNEFWTKRQLLFDLDKIADDKLNVAKLIISVSWAGKYWEKRRKYRLPAFCPFPTLVSKGIILRVDNLSGLRGNGVNKQMVFSVQSDLDLGHLQKPRNCSILHIPWILMILEMALENTVGKGEKCWWPVFSPFPSVFNSITEKNLHFSIISFLFCTCFQFGHVQNFVVW